MLWDAEPALPDKTAATGYRDSPRWPRTGLPAASFRRLMIKVDAHKNRINLDCIEILTDPPP
ncbi:hypothetical protein [Rhizobium leguminosarum]|uniref:hypothetical protein n=1 Tax=Rhizobium leguminosarum TaxID=384 RepID=UPI002FF3194E